MAPQGDVTGFKRIFQSTMPVAGGPVVKQEVLDLNNIPDPSGISAGTGLPGDVGLGGKFAFPFQTIERVLVMAPDVLAVANDNNYPFDTGRHAAVRTPADNERILVKLAAPLNRAGGLGVGWIAGQIECLAPESCSFSRHDPAIGRRSARPGLRCAG